MGTWLGPFGESGGVDVPNLVSLRMRTTPGVEYALIFDFAVFDDWDGTQNNDRFVVRAGGTQLLEQYLSETEYNRYFDPNTMWLDRWDNVAYETKSDKVFRDTTLRFTASAAETLIEFEAKVRNDSAKEGWALDNVRVITASALQATAAGLKVQWIENLPTTNLVETISFNEALATAEARQVAWISTRESPALNIDADRVGCRATGWLIVPSDATWEFRLTSDDGSTLRIDDQMIVANDGRHSPTSRTGSVSLTEGYHWFDVRGYEWTGVATLVVEWRRQGTSTWAVIPPSAFTQDAGVEIPFADVTASSGFDDSSSWLNFAQAWGDLNGDGFLDCVIGGLPGTVLLGSDDGVFLARPQTGFVFYQLSLCDVDNDGDIDYYSAYSGLRENNGSAGFTARGFPGGGLSFAYGLSTPDFDQDGWCDVAASGGGTAMLLRNLGSESAVVPIELTTAGLGDLFPGGMLSWNYGATLDVDLNDDGWPDLVQASGVSGVQAFISSESGYTNEQLAAATGSTLFVLSNCSAADIDNDGDLDLFNGANYPAAGNGMLMNVGGGTMVSDALIFPDAASRQWTGANFGDVDNDGDLDVVLRSFYENRIELRLNDGTGHFVAARNNFGTLNYPTDARLVDYDNDGDLDLAVIGYFGVTLFRNETNDDRFLKVRLIGGGAGGTNVAGVGTRVDLVDPNTGAVIARRDLSSSDGLGAGPTWLHFGVTASAEYIVRAHFASGIVEQTVLPSLVFSEIATTTVPQMVTLVETLRGRRVARWHETDQRGMVAGALRAEMLRRGMGEQLATLREMGLEDDVEQLLGMLGASSVREALGAQAGVLSDLQRDPRRD